jgi:hypothetical protein
LGKTKDAILYKNVEQQVNERLSQVETNFDAFDENKKVKPETSAEKNDEQELNGRDSSEKKTENLDSSEELKEKSEEQESEKENDDRDENSVDSHDFQWGKGFNVFQ